MNLEKYWRYTYIVQIAATFAMFLVLPTFWHEEHGTGLKLMEKALTTTIKLGLDPFDPKEFPVSQWWIVWVIPLMGLIIGLRAYTGIMFKSLSGQHLMIRLIAVLLILSSGWYMANFYRDLRIGFWLEMLFVGLQLLALFIEMSLPERYIDPDSRFIAPKSRAQLEEIAASQHQTFSPFCPECGTMNDIGAQKCRVCKTDLIRS